MSELKSRFLRVGGSSGELKFASKRLSSEEKKSSKDLRARKERRKTARSCQESSQKLPKGPQVTIHRACREIMSSPEAVTLFGPASAGRRRGVDGASMGVIFAIGVVP